MDILNHLIIPSRSSSTPAPRVLPASQQPTKHNTENPRPKLVPKRVRDNETRIIKKIGASKIRAEAKVTTLDDFYREQESEGQTRMTSDLYIRDFPSAGIPISQPWNFQEDENVTRPTLKRPHSKTGMTLYSIEDFESQIASPFQPPSIQPLVPTAVNPNVISEFNSLCQLANLKPDFCIKEARGQLFGGKVTFGKYEAEAPGLFPTKKSAKEAIAKQALEILKTVSPGSISNGKRKRDEDLLRTDENYVAALNRYVQKVSSHKKQPTYNEVPHPNTQFGCTVQLQDRWAVPFGDPEDRFSSKKNAKNVAAKAAVLWLRAEGKLTDRDSKRPRYSTDLPDLDGRVSLTTTDDPLGDSHSYTERIAQVALELGFQPPMFKLVAVTTAMLGRWDGHAEFWPRDTAVCPALAGPKGQVRNVHGKAAARKEIARGVLPLLQAIMAKRDGDLARATGAEHSGTTQAL